MALGLGGLINRKCCCGPQIIIPPGVSDCFSANHTPLIFNETAEFVISSTGVTSDNPNLRITAITSGLLLPQTIGFGVNFSSLVNIPIWYHVRMSATVTANSGSVSVGGSFNGLGAGTGHLTNTTGIPLLRVTAPGEFNTTPSFPPPTSASMELTAVPSDSSTTIQGQSETSNSAASVSTSGSVTTLTDCSGFTPTGVSATAAGLNNNDTATGTISLSYSPFPL